MRLFADFNMIEEDGRVPALLSPAQARKLKVGATVELTDKEGTECAALVDEVPTDARYIMARPIADSWRREPWTMPTLGPPEQTGKRKDLNEAAYDIVGKATGERESTASDKNVAAAELGRRGGLKGGPARAAKLSKTRRRSIARKAALARWSKKA